MDEITQKTIEELVKQLQSFSINTRNILPNNDTKPYIIYVEADSIHTQKSETAPKILYKLCSRCYNIIDSTWDHSTWCEAYEEEKLSAWIKKGKK